MHITGSPKARMQLPEPRSNLVPGTAVLLSAGVRRIRAPNARLTTGPGTRPVDLIAAKQRIAYIGAELQDKYAVYGWDLEVQDLVASGLHRTDLLLRPVTPGEGRRTAAMLERCGLGHLGKRRFLSLSYGQKRLALLARALVHRAGRGL